MLTTKDPRTFLAPLTPYIKAMRTVGIPDESLAIPAGELAAHARAAGVEHATAAVDVHDALLELARLSPPGRILICGSLYLAGYVLRLNAEPLK
jgi:dihydrofolate synthase/folylpolyglutamate synthase